MVNLSNNTSTDPAKEVFSAISLSWVKTGKYAWKKLMNSQFFILTILWHIHPIQWVHCHSYMVHGYNTGLNTATQLALSFAFYQVFVITKRIGLINIRLRLFLKDLGSSGQSTAGSFILFCCLSLYSGGKFCLCACPGTGSWHGSICP